MNIFNKDGFIWFIGVVESRTDDPLKAGRCRVRIYGYHSEDKNEQPTEDLPFATPIQPITSAAIAGKGTTPIGPAEGTWVVGFFLDGKNMQQPAFFGTIAGIPGNESTFEEPPKDPQTDNDQSKNKTDADMKDQSGIKITDGNNNPVKSGVPPVKDFKIGDVAKNNASTILPFGVGAGNKSVGFISDFKTSEDRFGARYGKYELASFLPKHTPGGKARPSAKGSPLSTFVKDSKFSPQFVGLEPGTDDFDNKWSEISSSDSFLFEKDQDDFMKKKYFDSFVSNLRRKGVDINKFGPSVKELGFTTALQSGPSGGTEIFNRALRGKSSINDNDILDSVGEFKKASADELFPGLDSSKLDSLKSELTSQKSSLDGLLPKVPSLGSFPDLPSLPGVPDLPGLPSLSGIEAFQGTNNDDLHYFGDDPIIYDRINAERIKRGLSPLANQRPT